METDCDHDFESRETEADKQTPEVCLHCKTLVFCQMCRGWSERQVDSDFSDQLCQPHKLHYEGYYAD